MNKSIVSFALAALSTEVLASTVRSVSSDSALRAAIAQANQDSSKERVAF